MLETSKYAFVLVIQKSGNDERYWCVGVFWQYSVFRD